MINAFLLSCSFLMPQPTVGTPQITCQEPVAASAIGVLPQGPQALQAMLLAHRFMLAAGIDPKDLANNLHYIARGNIWPMWACTYADGTVVYNKFRWYRDAQKVTEYFLGEPDEHDRDAFYYVGRQRYRWDTRMAGPFAQQHGGIVNISPVE